MVSSASRHGARFRTAADVREIVVRDGKVRGVCVAGGEQIDADVVISDADPTLTFGKLVSPDAVPSSLRRKSEATRPSLGSLVVYLGMKRSLRAHGLAAFNAWDYPDWDVEGQYAALAAGRRPSEPATFLSSSTERDDSGRLAPSGCSTLQIVTAMAWEPFAAWADLPPEQRPAEYRRLRDELAEQLLQTVDKRWPGLIGDIAVQRVSTPLSNADYTRAVRGGMYGPEQTPDCYGRRRFAPSTPIRGLYLTGSGVFGGGIATCLQAGRTAAALALREGASAGRTLDLRRGFERLLQAR